MQSDSQPTNLAVLIEALSAKLAAGETLELVAIPEQFLQTPEVQNLLRLARVNNALDANRALPAPRTAMPEHIAQWRIVRLLGQGGMGDVWLGAREQTDLVHQVAIKCVRTAHPRFIERLKLERQILAKLNHPNVASFIDAGIDAQGMPWMAMEYIDGSNICDWCERNRLSLEARIQLFLKVCAAVAHAHRHLIVHRDIKPGNILVNAESEPKLLDFGISKLLGAEAEQTTVHSLTPSYAAPEQLRGGVISTATDVYALGLLLFRLIAGTLPHTRQDLTLAQVLEKLDQEETARPSEAARGSDLPYTGGQLGGDLDAIVFKALRLDPQLRYDGAAAFALDLQRYLAREPVSARAPTWRYRAQRFGRRHAVALGFSTLALLGILVGSALALQQASRAERAAAQAIQQAARADAQSAAAIAQSARAKGAAQFLLKVFEQSDPLRRDARGAISLDQAFEDALKRARTIATKQPLLAIDLYDDFGEVLANKGRFDESIALFTDALKLIDQHYPKTSPVRAETLTNLATLHDFQGKPELAAQGFKEALGILEPQPEADPILLGTLLMQTANRESVSRNYRQAEALGQRALALHGLHMDPNDPRLPSTIAAMGAILRSMDGRFADAGPLLDEAVATAEANQGFDSAGLIMLLNEQRSHANAMGQKERTVRASTRMLDIAQKAFPGNHPLHAMALLELGSLRLILDPKSDGAKLLERAIAMHAQLGSKQELRAWRLYHGGLVNWSLWPEAMRISELALPRCKALSWKHTECMYLRAERVVVLAQSERGAQALQEIDALEANVKQFGLTGVDTDVIIVKARAEALLASGKKTQALALLESLLPIYTKRWGAENSFTKQLKTCVAQWRAGEKVYCTW
jgi:eukaryotic-like serine/threonine-protein kinase